MATTSPAPTPAPASAPKGKLYTALTPVDYNNKRYEIGSQLRLEKEDADPLLAVNAIAPVGKEAKEGGAE